MFDRLRPNPGEMKNEKLWMVLLLTCLVGMVTSISVQEAMDVTKMKLKAMQQVLFASFISFAPSYTQDLRAMLEARGPYRPLCFDMTTLTIIINQ